MKPILVRSRVASLVIVIVLLLQVTPALAGGPFNRGDDDRKDVDITFTKWITTFPLMAGFVGGDVVGGFSGEVLDARTTADLLIPRLEAVYEIQAGHHSFTALIQGGQNNQTGRAVLDGVILGGSQTGDRIHVEYQVKTNCASAPAGTCFQGTIHIERASED
jgi:hypothetical protein